MSRVVTSAQLLEYQRVSANQASIHVAMTKPGPKGVIVLLHGFPQTHWCFRHVIQPLAEAGYQVIAPDLRGYGKSTKVGPFDIGTLAADIVGVLDALNIDKATVVGHDWGGATAWQIAAYYPARCERLVIVNSPHPVVFQKALTSSLRQLRRSWYMFFFQLPWLPERLLAHNDGALVPRMLRAASKRRGHLSDDEVQPYRAALSRADDVSPALGVYRAIPRQALEMMRGGKTFPRVETKTLIVWGKKDPALDFDVLVPATARYVKDLTVETLDGVGHFVPDEAPAELAQHILRFLASE